MGSMTRQWRRQARRRLGLQVDITFEAIERLRERGEVCDDEETIADCDEAFAALEATLTPDGLPTTTTAAVLPGVVDGPLTRAIRRVRPDIDLASDDQTESRAAAE